MTEKIKLLKTAFPHYSIGEGSYGEAHILNWTNSHDTLSIGAYCSLSFGVVLMLGGGHRTDWVTTYPFSAILDSAAHIKGHPTSGEIRIGNDVWIGGGSMVLSGATIGDGAAIGARSLVNSNIPPYAIAAGHPAKVIRYRFPPDVVERLLRVAWWSWEPARIEKAMPFLLQTNIHAFLEAAERGEI